MLPIATQNLIKMKKIIILLVVASIAVTACNSNNKSAETAATDNPNQLYACSMHPEIVGKKDEKCSKCGMKLTVPVKESVKDTVTTSIAANVTPTATPTETKVVSTQTVATTNTNFSIADVVSNYIALKNALTKDDGKAAANAGKAIVIAMAKLDANTLDAAKKKAYTDVADDAKEHAEHIGDNASKLDHQREHFAMLSKDVNDLIKVFGSTTKLYQDFCPMYDDGKGAIWISEIKEIKNPYFGTKMITCGSIKKEF
jgi:hypothetical protein